MLVYRYALFTTVATFLLILQQCCAIAKADPLSALESESVFAGSTADYRFITAFYDIGRGQWQNKYNRSAATYLERFSLLVQLNLPLVVFMDDRYAAEARAIIESVASSLPAGAPPLQLQLIMINENFLSENIQSWSYVAVEEEIMRSAAYQAMAQLRSSHGNPETLYPQYNCINHAKVDFVEYYVRKVLHNRSGIDDGCNGGCNGGGDGGISSSGVTVTHVGWVDFGYLTEAFEVMPFAPNRALLYNGAVNFLSHGEPTAREVDPAYVFQEVPIRIHGAFWFGSVQAVLGYRQTYHACVHEMHGRGVADDDQSVTLCCYFKGAAAAAGSLSNVTASSSHGAGRSEGDRDDAGKKDGEEGGVASMSVLDTGVYRVDEWKTGGGGGNMIKLWKNEIWANIDGVVQRLWYIAFFVFNSLVMHEPVTKKFMADNGHHATSALLQ